MATLHDFRAISIDGTDIELSSYAGKVVLVVNTASDCGERGLLGRKVRWNFTKFLVGRDGEVLGRYSPTTEPAKIADDIEKAL